MTKWPDLMMATLNSITKLQLKLPLVATQIRRKIRPVFYRRFGFGCPLLESPPTPRTSPSSSQSLLRTSLWLYRRQSHKVLKILVPQRHGCRMGKWPMRSPSEFIAQDPPAQTWATHFGALPFFAKRQQRSSDSAAACSPSAIDSYTTCGGSFVVSTSFGLLSEAS